MYPFQCRLEDYLNKWSLYTIENMLSINAKEAMGSVKGRKSNSLKNHRKIVKPRKAYGICEKTFILPLVSISHL